jgi:hypothetical protein
MVKKMGWRRRLKVFVERAGISPPVLGDVGRVEVDSDLPGGTFRGI